MQLLYSALGGNAGHPLKPYDKYASLERVYHLDEFKSFFSQHNPSKENKIVISKIERITKNQSKILLWGTDSLIDINKNDLVFFGYKNCIFYYGKVLGTFQNKDLSLFLWGDRNKWKKKVIMESLVKTYIPRNINAYRNSAPERIMLGLNNKDEYDFNFLNFTEIFAPGNFKSGPKMGVTSLVPDLKKILDEIKIKESKNNTDVELEVLKSEYSSILDKTLMRLDAYHYLTKNDFLLNVVLEEN